MKDKPEIARARRSSDVAIMVYFTQEQAEEIRLLAQKYFGGNRSALIRFAVANYFDEAKSRPELPEPEQGA